MKQHLTVPLHPVMQDGGWILDVDTTVKPIHGNQEGAMVGYTPRKPGRPSHCYHTYLLANLRLVPGVDVTPGNESNSTHCLPGLLEILDDLRPEMRPLLVRGDIGYGTGSVMSALEERGQHYLFRLRMTKRTKELTAKLSTERGWSDVGQGWAGTGSVLNCSWRAGVASDVSLSCVGVGRYLKMWRCQRRPQKATNCFRVFPK